MCRSRVRICTRRAKEFSPDFYWTSTRHNSLHQRTHSAAIHSAIFVSLVQLQSCFWLFCLCWYFCICSVKPLFTICPVRGRSPKLSSYSFSNNNNNNNNNNSNNNNNIYMCIWMAQGNDLFVLESFGLIHCFERNWSWHGVHCFIHMVFDQIVVCGSGPSGSRPHNRHSSRHRGIKQPRHSQAAAVE